VLDAQEAEKGVRQLRALSDRASGLQSQGLAYQALLQQTASLRAGLSQAYVKLRGITSSALPPSIMFSS
jgi:hypothetical protein